MTPFLFFFFCFSGLQEKMNSGSKGNIGEGYYSTPGHKFTAEQVKPLLV